MGIWRIVLGIYEEHGLVVYIIIMEPNHILTYVASVLQCSPYGGIPLLHEQDEPHAQSWRIVQAFSNGLYRIQFPCVQR